MSEQRVTAPLKQRASNVARSIYRAAPVSPRLKLRLKDGVYGSLGPVFRGTPSYAAWRNDRDTQVRDTWQSDSSATIQRAQASLKPADGTWEWAAHDEVAGRIAAITRTRKREQSVSPRKIIRVADDELRAAAGRVRLPPPTDHPDVSIIIPTYGQLKFTIECLLSISAARDSTHTFEVIVADDASTDDTVEVVSAIANLRVATQGSNVGFLRNCNSAAAQARGRLLVFLNNDTQVSPGWLDALASVFRDEPNVGAVGPRFVYPNGHLQEAGVAVRRWGGVEMIGLSEAPEDPRWGYRRDVDYVSGACVMIEAAEFRELGGFDESLAPAYCEDLDLGLRLYERGKRSIYEPKAEVVHHLSVTTAQAGAGVKGTLVTRNLQVVAERHSALLDQLDDVRFAAFYLPQYYPFPQNDLWWGKGFTEWTNVVQAKPNWEGHYQPRLPADLGFYDLRLAENMDRQWELADRYGIDALCFYYYWFAGTRLLDKPLERLLDHTRPAHPFLLCWANENWTRRWDGRERDVLIGQKHSPEDDLAVIRDLARYLSHPAYLRVNGRPMLLVYRVELFPSFAQTAERWRTECIRLGVGEINLVMVESFQLGAESVNPASYGCDAVVEFPAHNIQQAMATGKQMLNSAFRGTVADYADVAVAKATRPHPGHKLYRSVMPGWDNTARRQDASFVIEDATPGAFQAWLETTIAETKRDLQGDDRLIFINAWNEWAEGAYLEPDRRFGHSWLEAVQKARDTSRHATPDWAR